MRATSRLVDCSINTVTKLLVDIGYAYAFYQDEALRDIKSKRVQCDEIWSFCYSKEKKVTLEDKGVIGMDCYTWTAIDADTKLTILWLAGRCDGDHAETFIADLASRLRGRIQLTTDGYGPYIDAVEKAFGGAIAIDYVMLVKIYDGKTEGQKRYSPAAFVGAEKRRITGNPDIKEVSTSYERQNLIMRMGIRRFTRLTNGFSKKIENSEHSVALHFMHYNFGRIHETLRVTPAMEAGIADHV